MPSDGFTWSGSLDETDIQSLYAACQSLRFSGKLELRDGAIKAEVTFVGGEPIEIDGGDTQRIALWNRGMFRAVQSIPNLAGELTGQREMEGSLAITKASQLWAWVSEYRLTCEIDLERPGSRAVVSFSNGHAEAAQVNGAPELAALARVSSWTDGTFRVRLKPLFLDGIIPAAPPMPEGAPPAGRQFDVSRSIPMDLKPRDAQGRLAPASFGPPKMVQPTPPLGELAMGGMSSGPSERSRPHEERTSETRPLPPPEFARNAVKGTSKKSPFDPLELSKPYPRHDAGAGGRPRSKMPWLLSLTGILVAGGFGALYYYHLPPFSPPPKAVDATPPSGEAVKPSGEAVKPSGEAVAPSGAAVKPSGEAVKPSGEAVKPSGEAVKPTGEAVKPTGVAVKPTGVAQKTEKPEIKKPEPPKEKPTDKLVAKGRLLLIEGHSHTALEQFRRASKLAPKDASLKVNELQAMGKLGKAQILLEGKGSAVVDGHKFSSPAKLKLMAGPHVVDAGDGENELSLKKGEKRRIRVKK
jgi:hypothetical protein